MSDFEVSEAIICSPFEEPTHYWRLEEGAEPEKQPGRRPAIVVGAHYDTEATVPGHVGANDGAAGTAAASTPGAASSSTVVDASSGSRR